MIELFQNEVMQPAFWLAFGKIVWIDILLSGDNALVIAMACRSLPAKQRLWGMILGAGAAVAMRIAFTGIVASLMELPYLKLAGGLALMFVATKLLVPDNSEANVEPSARLWSAIRVVMVADMVMSLDNVIAIAAASQGSILLLAAGLVISIPLVVAGAALITGVLNRFPILIWAGAALLGWISGEVIATDPAIVPLLSSPFEKPEFYAVICVCIVLVAGATWRSMSANKPTAEPAE